MMEPFVIMRHDVDRRPEMALEMAGIERDLGDKGDVLFQDGWGVLASLNLHRKYYKS